MGVRYSIEAKLEAVYNKDSIRDVLKNGLKIKASYHKSIFSSLDSLSLKDALSKVLELDSELGMHCLTICVDNIYLNLLFLNNTGDLSVVMSGLSIEWSKVYKHYYSDSYDVDLAKYMQLFFNLIDGFKVQELKVERA